MAKVIGIPRALLYYKYYPFWKKFLEKLGYEVIISGRTNQRILHNGIKHTIDESCLPVKVFCGHVLDLIDKGVDYLFIPRIESVEKKHFVCTKFLGLPDIIRNCIETSPPILSPNIDFKRRFLYQSMFSVGYKLTKNPIKIHNAYWQAKRKLENFEDMVKTSKTPQEVLNLIETNAVSNISEADPMAIKNGDSKTHRNNLNQTINQQKIFNKLNIAVIGHPYNVYDDFINQGILRKLEVMGVNVLTQEMVSKKASHKIAEQVSSDLCWTYGKEILGASIYFTENKVDGIIFIISFPCGPDSLTVEYAIRKIKSQVPILSLVIDEHQAEAGIITRLESFIDLVRMRKRK